MGSRFREIADREVTHPDVPDPARPVEGLESLHRLPQGDLAPRIRPMHLIEVDFRTPRRFRLAAHAFFTSSARRCHPPTFVATKTRSRPTFRIARDMTRSEWPSPYASAVSTRLIPSSTARSIASRHSASRTSEPQAFPPACHIPSPTAETSGPPRPNDTYSI